MKKGRKSSRNLTLPKATDRFIIDFENGGAIQPTETSAAFIANRLKFFSNPYTGNKRKILLPIFMAIENRGWKYDSFLDLFSGSGMVSAAARYLGKNVTSNDLSLYAYYSAIYFLEVKTPLTDEAKKMLWDESLEVKPFIQTLYAERFTPEEAFILDRFRTNIQANTEALGIDAVMLLYLSILHYVSDHCFVGGFLNKGQVLAEMNFRINHARNQGAAMSFKDISWLKPMHDLASKPVGHAMHCDALDLIKTPFLYPDVAYLDPPYGGAQSNYAQMYKFFDDYLLGASSTETEANTRFVKEKSYQQQFDLLMEGVARFPRLVLSYNNESWAKVDDIVASIKRFRKDVVVEKVDYKYNYRADDDEDDEKPRPDAEEYIILAE